MIQKEDFYFDSRDGEHQIHAIRWIPEAERPVCILQIIHGMAEYIDRYDEFAQFMAKKGILVVGDDHLGHGKSVREGEPFGYFCKEDAPTVLVRDEHRLKKMMQEKNPGVPYLILGHSMGSFIARNYLIRYGSGIEGAVIMGTGMQPRFELVIARALASIQCFILGPKHVSRLIDRLAFGGYNRRIPSPKTSSDWICANAESVARYVEDPLCGFVFTANGFQTLMKLIWNLNDVDNLKKMPRQLPIFLVSGEEDPVGDYGRAVKEVYDSYIQMGMEHVQMKLYPGDRHEILNEADRVDVYGDIYRWILQIVT